MNLEHLIMSPPTSDYVRQQRELICDDCPLNNVGICEKDRLVVQFKAAQSEGECPEGLWEE